VFESRVMRNIICVSKGGVIKKWRKLHNDMLHNLYSSTNIIRVIKSRWVRWAGYVARKREKVNANRVLVGKLQERKLLENQGVVSRVILKRILNK
jgi:hypothetical protein